MTARAGERPLPDFAIVGAPRSGTTFMYEYLSAHPRVFMSPVKEPNFFDTDLDSGSYLDSLSFMRERDRYRALYASAKPDQLTGEASTWYLFSREAAANLYAANPQAKVIAMLRDPVEMLYSLHERRMYGGSEDLKSFADALAAEPDRAAGRRIPLRARNVKALQYRAVGRYAEQLERYVERFGREAVHVVVFDDFRADPAAAYRGVVEFLGLSPIELPELRVVNEAAERRSWRLQQALLSPGMIRLARIVFPPPVRPYVGRAWDRINSRGRKRAPLDAAVAARLREDLRPDVERLSEMLGRDLSALWWPTSPRAG
jgi:hypothetical protein